MTDNLRDRITAVLYERTMSRLSWHRSWADLHSDVQGLWLDDADAVIAALGLRGCTDPWHWETGEPFRCPSCGYWMGEGYVEP